MMKQKNRYERPKGFKAKAGLLIENADPRRVFSQIRCYVPGRANPF